MSMFGVDNNDNHTIPVVLDSASINYQLNCTAAQLLRFPSLFEE